MLVFMTNKHNTLSWPVEAVVQVPETQDWHHSGSNLCLDFHGDPCRAGLTVFSDGNHHMALEACLQAFVRQNPTVGDIFYATTPPAVLIGLMKQGSIRLGNLSLSCRPDIFIGPQNILEQLAGEGLVQMPKHFMRSRCNVLLVANSNPKEIVGIQDLLRDDVQLFISNPQTEKASFQVYSETLLNMAVEQGLPPLPFHDLLAGKTNNIVYGEQIHHRELPQAIADGQADVAVVYYHLALRYTRIFPDLFDIIPLGGSAAEPAATPAHHLTDYAVAVVNADNPHVEPLMNHLFSELTTEIYTHHGLVRS